MGNARIEKFFSLDVFPKLLTASLMIFPSSRLKEEEISYLRTPSGQLQMVLPSEPSGQNTTDPPTRVRISIMVKAIGISIMQIGKERLARAH